MPALLARIEADPALPGLAGELFAMQAAEYAQLQAKLALVEARLLAWHRADERSRRLAQIPGIGPIGAVLLTMKTPAPEAFRSGRPFAAWIGLTPRDHATAGKVRLGVMTRAGDEALRSVLVVGATALIATAFAQPDATAAKLQFRAVADQIRSKVPKLTDLMDEAKTDVLASHGEIVVKLLCFDSSRGERRVSSFRKRQR